MTLHLHHVAGPADKLTIQITTTKEVWASLAAYAKGSAVHLDGLLGTTRASDRWRSVANQISEILEEHANGE